MSLSDKAIQMLNEILAWDKVSEREGSKGAMLSYLETHMVKQTANRIFGYGEWSYETISTELVTYFDLEGTAIGQYYVARVKLTVNGALPITEEGMNAVDENGFTGMRQGKNGAYKVSPYVSFGAHDMARKGCISDGVKRCFTIFGEQFGLKLHDDEYIAGRKKEEAERKRREVEQNRASIQLVAKPIAQPTQIAVKPMAQPALIAEAKQPTSVATTEQKPLPLEPATPKPQVAANANIKRQLPDNFIPGRKAAELVALLKSATSIAALTGIEELVKAALDSLSEDEVLYLRHVRASMKKQIQSVLAAEQSDSNSFV